MTHENIDPTVLLPGNGARKELDNLQVQGIIIGISKGRSDKYGVSNPQGAKGKISLKSYMPLIRLTVHRIFASI